MRRTTLSRPASWDDWMRRAPSVLLLLALWGGAAAVGATAQPSLPEAPGPGLAVVVHHPFPDAADPLGFPWPDEGGSGAWTTRMRHLDAAGDGFDYPTLVVDGTLLLEGPPPPEGEEDLQAAADRAYADAVRRHAATEPPLTLKVYTQREEGRLIVMAQAEPRAPLQGEALRLWAALVEDPVHFEPPPALSNGVADHPFTLRALADVGALDLSGGGSDGSRFEFALDPAWRTDHLWVSVWVQQGGGPGLRFGPHEVVQATMHRADAGHVTVQQGRGVLVEALSATWCDPCLFGDRAVQTLARTHGVVTEEDGTQWRYLRRPAAPLLVAAAAVGGAWLLAGRREVR